MLEILFVDEFFLFAIKFNYFQIISVFLPLSISTLLEGFLDEAEESVNFDANVKTGDKKQETVVSIHEKKSLSQNVKEKKEEYGENIASEDDEDAVNEDEEMTDGENGRRVRFCVGID